jgi:hypothetical protein
MQNMNSGLSFEASIVKSTNRFAALDLVENSQEDHESSYNDENAARGHVRKHLSQIIDRGSAVAPKEQSKKVGAENDPYQLKEHPISGRHRQVVDERIRNDSLCSACQSILDPHQVFDQLGPYGVTDTDEQILHKEYRSFDSAVCSGCYICSLLKQKLEFEFLVKDPDTRLEENKKIESDFQSLHYKISQEEFDLRLTFQYSGSDGIITRSDILQLQMCYVSGMLPQIRSGNRELIFSRYRKRPSSHSHHKLGSIQKRHGAHSVLAPSMSKQTYELLADMESIR